MRHYTDILKNQDNFKTTLVKTGKKRNLIVHKFSYYVCLWYYNFQFQSNGSIKCKVKKDKNYTPLEYYTLYYNKLGYEITRLEFYKQLKGDQ